MSNKDLTLFTRKHYINIISIAVIFLINVLFLIKYLYVYELNLSIIILSYSVIFILLTLLINNIDFEFVKPKYFLLIYLLVVAVVIIFVITVPRIGRIGRLPAILDWLNLYFAGVFPYSSSYTPSAFPGLFLTAYPFYVIGNLGLLIPLGLLLLFIFAYNFFKTSKENILFLFLLISSPVFYYEAAVRSELFYNISLVTILILITEKFVNPDKINLSFFLAALFGGLVLSTRSVTALIFIIYFLYFFRYNLKNLFLYSFINVVVFLALLLPFMMWDINAFNKTGPFAIQSFLSYLPFAVVVLFLLISIYTGWMVRSVQEVLFSSGLILFLMVFISMIIKIFEFGFYSAMMEDKFDLSYYAFSLLLLFLSIKEYKIDYYRGRIIEVE
ncbi:MAG TPA: hypothetical protein VFF33_00755 [Ignavibacteriaceae bacterium]|nr:hypothetical protein [Ignavibacteriaceae bacterium]